MDIFRDQLALSGFSAVARAPAGVRGHSVPAGKHRVVIVGAGFGGLSAARALARSEAEVTIIDRMNYHLFQPLLYQVATAELSPADIAWPIRALLRDQPNARVVMAEVTGVDAARRAVVLSDGARVGYDTLVLATGARHAYFGHEDWATYAPGLKEIDDATEIRRRILLAFERAEAAPDMDRMRANLTFAVIGAGPTGVEMAGAIAELSMRTLVGDFRSIDPKATRVLLIEAGPRVLPTFSEALSAKAQRQLERVGVEVRTGAPVTECGPGGLMLGGEWIAAETLVWAAGVMASPAGRWIDAQTDRAGRVIVKPDLSVPRHPEIFVIGDTASAKSGEAQVPGVAPAAKQMGEYVGRTIAGRLAGRSEPPAFRYRDDGSLATIGRNAAVAQIGRLQLSGFVAWMLWAVAHIFFLIGVRSRIVVAVNWAWTWVTHSRGARLITGGSREGAERPDRADAA